MEKLKIKKYAFELSFLIVSSILILSFSLWGSIPIKIVLLGLTLLLSTTVFSRGIDVSKKYYWALTPWLMIVLSLSLQYYTAKSFTIYPSEQWISDDHLVLYAEKGEYLVGTLTYGSGKDVKRKRYGANVDIQTEDVRLQHYLPNQSRKEKWIREKYWGFSLSATPINGMVWYPEAKGRFPLVLIAHGNADMGIESEKGYQYLGEHLASHGYIVASIDQNFLNGHALGGYRGEEMGLRAILFLEHLKVWEKWSTDADSPFYNKIDWNNTTLIGHSRGGEAAAIAGFFSDLERHPANGLVRLPQVHPIKNIIALAPTDSFYKPGGNPIQLENKNYLLLHGGHDGDLRTMMGLNQYHRVNVSEDFYIKSSVYVHEGNHAGFNQKWAYDRSFPYYLALNSSPLIKSEEQERITCFFVTAFLDHVIHSNQDLLEVFTKPYAYENVLPQAQYRSLYKNSAMKPLVNFNENVNLSRWGEHLGEVEAYGFSSWREQYIPLRSNRYRQENRALYLEWLNEPGGHASYRFLFSQHDEALSERNFKGIYFNLMWKSGEKLNFKVQLNKHDGQVLLWTSEDLVLFQPLPIQYSWLNLWDEKNLPESEYIFQNYQFSSDEMFTFSEIESIEFIFDKSEEASILIDEMGLILY